MLRETWELSGNRNSREPGTTAVVLRGFPYITQGRSLRRGVVVCGPRLWGQELSEDNSYFHQPTKDLEINRSGPLLLMSLLQYHSRQDISA